jgi:DNA polymerase III alpha subunit
MSIDKYGRSTLTEKEALEAIYSNSYDFLNSVYFSDTTIVSTFNQAVEKNADNIPLLKLYQTLDIEVKDWDTELQSQWFMPSDYCPNLVEILYGMCKTKEQVDRVSAELELFIQHNMMDLLFYLKYLVDTLRQNKIVWGVGRGSSVASYVLFLIGVHKIDSIKYDLDIKEFLK